MLVPDGDAPADGAVHDGGITVDDMSLARRVSMYLARVVDELVEFEDALLASQGFFAREERFETKIKQVHLEFEGTRRAQVLFEQEAATRLLVTQLTASMPVDPPGCAPELVRRRLQFVFAAAVLLSSATTSATVLKSPALLAQFWDYVAQPAPLHPVQLQYWVRCAGALLLMQPLEQVRAAVDVPTVLHGLVRHASCDAVCLP